MTFSIPELRALIEKATPGPWEYGDVDSIAGGSLYGNGWMLASLDWNPNVPQQTGAALLDTDFRTSEVADANGELIAALANAAPGLLDAAEEAEQRRADMEHPDYRGIMAATVAERDVALARVAELEADLADCVEKKRRGNGAASAAIRLASRRIKLLETALRDLDHQMYGFSDQSDDGPAPDSYTVHEWREIVVGVLDTENGDKPQ